MLSLFISLSIISTLLLIVGLFKPSWVTAWRAKEARTRKYSLVFYGSMTIGALLIYLGLLVGWLFFFLLNFILLGALLIIGLCLGLILPKKVVVFGVNTRKKVLFQYGGSIISILVIIIAIGSMLPTEEVDERIVGATYVGEYKNGVKHGKGKASNHSSYYEGQWVEDKRNGHGIEVTDFGLFTIKYDGQWENNLENGNGKMTMKVLWMDMVYEGDWKNGKREGYGKFIDRGGNIYEGEWVNDAPNGKGKSILKNGETYEGEVKDWKRHGYGKHVMKDGEVLEGNWVEDELVNENS